MGRAQGGLPDQGQGDPARPGPLNEKEQLDKKFAQAFLKGQPHKAAIATTLFKDKIEQLEPLAGIVTGTAVGVAAAFARPVLARIPAPVAAAMLGAMAMAGSDGPLVALDDRAGA